MKDIVYFLLFLYVILFIHAISNFILNDKDQYVLVSIADQYRLMFGENTDASDMEGQLTLLVFYVIGTNTIVVISLNILISIVTDNYDNVLMRMNAID